MTASAVLLCGGCGGTKTESGGAITESKLGVRIYPGATIVTSGETDDIVSANLRTPDAPEKVIGFYESELGAKGSGDPASYTISGSKGGKTYVIAVNRDSATNVSIMGRK